MVDTNMKTTDVILAGIPNELQRGRAQGGRDLGLLDQNVGRSLALKAMQGVTKVVTGLATSDGTSGSTIALYRVDFSAGTAQVDAKARIIAAAADTVLLGTGTWAKSYDLEGDAAVVLTADGKTYECVVVAINDTTGNASLHAVFGAEADDGDEESPTLAEIRTALAAAVSSWDGTNGMVVARIKIQRVATDTITMTHTDPTSDSALATERLAGTLWADAS